MAYKTEFQANNTDLQAILDTVNGLPEALDTSDATAIADNILKDRTAYVKGEKLTGTMGLHEDAETVTLNCGESFQIIGGYHTGGKVTANTLASQTSATATAGDIASGKTAWVNGSKVTGSLEPVNITKVTLNKSTVTSTIQNDAFKGKTNIVGQNWSFGRTVVIWVYIINGGYDGFVYHETAYRPTFSLNASTGELKSNYNFAAGDWTFYVW